MRDVPLKSPVEDSVPKVSEEVAVGEDLEFQRKWWRFEQIIWPILLLIVLIDMLGGFGRGWLANAHRSSSDDTLTLDYERIARASTPSVMTLKFGPNAIENGHITVYVSDSIVKPLGAQRIAPQPKTSIIGEKGITYVFDATQTPASVQIALEPSFPGYHKFMIGVKGSPMINAGVFVVP